MKFGVVKVIGQIQEEKMKTTQLQALKEKYPTVFSGKLGKLKNQSIKLDIVESIKPTKQKLRRLPEKLKNLVKQEIIDMEKQGIIERVNWPTKRCSVILIIIAIIVIRKFY